MSRSIVLDLNLAIDLGDIGRASRALAGACMRHGVPDDAAHKLDMCLNEILANVMAHGGLDPAEDRIRVLLGVDPVVRDACLQVQDWGAAFDPTTQPPRPMPKTLAEAEPGGLGLKMLRAYSDALSYLRVGEQNQLSATVRWRAPEDCPGMARFRRRSDDAPPATADGKDTAPVERRKGNLDWIPLFQGLEREAVYEAIGDCEVRVLPAGASLLTAGEPNRSVFILLAGELEAHLQDDTGIPLSRIPIQPGECIGELSAIDGKPASATVQAKSECRILVLTAEAFWHRLLILPGAAHNQMSALTARMRRTNELALRTQREHLELEHLRKELSLARDLQMGMVPLDRPIFPGRSDIEICGFMEPASNVGGDLFDAFFTDDDLLFFCIGDVSGHGIAAALFMARTIGLLRMMAQVENDPARLLADVNDRLCEGNRTETYVTLFCGFLDLASGRIRYANAGHCAPLLMQGGRHEFLAEPHGPLAGAFSGVQYVCGETVLEPGAVLLCHTDGVTEAANAEGTQWGDVAYAEALADLRTKPLPELLDGLRAALARHAGERALEDDCTLLALRR